MTQKYIARGYVCEDVTLMLANGDFVTSNSGCADGHLLISAIVPDRVQRKQTLARSVSFYIEGKGLYRKETPLLKIKS
jgi:hypothetical protein